MPENSMLDALKFAKGAISKKDLVPVLSHFSIKDGVIRGYNGLVCLAAPIGLSIDCQPRAIPFTKAIDICEGLEETPALSLTKAGRLTVSAGKFKVHVECSEEEYPDIKPEGQRIELSSPIIEALKTLAPMVAEDASRPWARGVLFREGSAFATNNVVIGQYYTGIPLPFDMNVPDECIKEVIRVKQNPVAIQADQRSITFHFADGRWIKSQLLTTVWPSIAPVLDRPSQPRPLVPDFFDSLRRLSHYADATRKVYLQGNQLRTHTVEGVGAIHDFKELEGGSDSLRREELRGCYNIDQLQCLDGMVATIDWSLYPAPALFFGHPAPGVDWSLFRGAIVGMKP